MGFFTEVNRGLSAPSPDATEPGMILLGSFIIAAVAARFFREG